MEINIGYGICEFTGRGMEIFCPYWALITVKDNLLKFHITAKGRSFYLRSSTGDARLILNPLMWLSAT